MKHLLLGLTAFSLLLIQTPQALAATATSKAPLPGEHPSLGGTVTPKPDALSSCFEHYRFGSVPAVISTSLSNASQGSTLGFTGTLTNENTYPIIDATVHIKIFHTRSNQGDGNGPDVVDFFPALEHVNLKAKEAIPLSFTWKVPADLEPGEYQAVTYVTSSDRFELQGLSFTDDVVGNQANFTVTGDKLGALRFVKDSVKVNDQIFRFAAFPPTLPNGLTNYPVTADVANTTDNPVDSKVTWSLYYWDALSESHLLDTKTDELKVHPHATTTVSYTVKDKDHSVYFLKGDIVTAKGAHSIIGVRFVRSDVNEPRFNFVTVDGATAVACIHSTGTGPSKDAHVSLSVTSNVWYAPLLRVLHLGTLASASYSGDIPGEIYALTAPIKSGASSYTIHADLSQKGKSIDSLSQSYTCSDLGTKCPNIIIEILIALIPLVILALIIFAFIYWRRKKGKTPPTDMTTTSYTIPPNPSV